MNRFRLSLLGSVAIAALSISAALAAPPNISGTWNIQQTGNNGTTTSTISLTQSGTGIVGSNASTGNGFTGTFVSDGKSTESGTVRAALVG